QPPERRGSFGPAQLKRKLGGFAAGLGTLISRKPWPKAREQLEQLLLGAKLAVEGCQLGLHFQILWPVASTLLQVTPRRLRQSHLEGGGNVPTGRAEPGPGGGGGGVGGRGRSRQRSFEVAESVFGLTLSQQFRKAHSPRRELAILLYRLSQQRLFLRRSRNHLRRFEQQFCFGTAISGQR